VDIERLLHRRRRATALIAVAVCAIAAASFAYLYSSQAPKPQGVPESRDSLKVTRDYVTYNFISPSEGWALDIAPNTSITPGQFTIFRTVDRGKHWKKQLSSNSDYFQHGAMPVQTIDAAHSFVLVRGATEVLYRTVDGGAHWNTVALPDPHVQAVVFSDPNYGWLLAGWTGRDLYVTRDAGASWQRRPPPPGSFRLSLRSPNEAWLSGFVSASPYVYVSTDEGQTWQRHDLPPPPGGSWGTGPYFQLQLLPRAGVVVSDVLGGGPTSFFATSFDGGLTWAYVQSPPGTVAYQDAFHWWAMRGTTLSKSADAGQTWSQVTNALPDWLYRTELHVLDATHAWVTFSVPASLSAPGGNGLAFTDDGGLHWTQAQVPQSG
jgi:photosystem II stability/assembly factor-like uncharacterized protein